MAERLCFLVDTNVVFKWYVTEREGNLTQARGLWEDFIQSRVDLLAPAFLPYELANLFRVAVGQGRLPEIEARAAFNEFEASGILVVNTDTSVRQALSLALIHGISVFDALLLLVGLRSNLPLVTDDEKLARAGADARCAVIRLAEYRPAMGQAG